MSSGLVWSTEVQREMEMWSYTFRHFSEVFKEHLETNEYTKFLRRLVKTKSREFMVSWIKKAWNSWKKLIGTHVKLTIQSSWIFYSVKFDAQTRNNWNHFLKAILVRILLIKKTIRLFAFNFFDVIVDLINYHLLIYGSVSQGLGTTKFTNLIEWLKWILTAV